MADDLWKEVLSMAPEDVSKLKYNDPRLDSFTGAVEARYGLPSGLILAVKNAGERSNTGQVSSAGAKGVMQFIDSTRNQYQHDPNDPLASIDAAGRYFKDLMERYGGNVKAAIAEYNGGVKAAKAVLDGKEIPYEETRNYLKRIKGFMQKQSLEIKSADAYSDDELASMSQATLLEIRDKTKDQSQQNRAAAFEHRAFAREQVYESIGNAPGVAVATPLYTAAKALGLVSGRSEASLDQMLEGFKGISEGIEKRIKEMKDGG